MKDAVTDAVDNGIWMGLVAVIGVPLTRNGRWGG